MDADKKKLSSKGGDNNDLTPQKDDKFKLVNCANGGIHCKYTVLPVINRLYKESDTYRIDKEYQKSLLMLQQAYDKTLELWESSCSVCVIFLQKSIEETMKELQAELQGMSSGWFATGRFKYVYEKLGQVLRSINGLEISEST